MRGTAPACGVLSLQKKGNMTSNLTLTIQSSRPLPLFLFHCWVCDHGYKHVFGFLYEGPKCAQDIKQINQPDSDSAARH